MRTVVLAALLLGCSTNDDVVGPFTGTTQRYALYMVELPRTNTMARTFGGDLNGDGSVDNQLGQVISTLAVYNDVTAHAADMIAGGSIPTALEITADDFTDDDSVGVRYLGVPGSRYVELGGTFKDGTFQSNFVATTDVPGQADLYLPVFTEADPSVLDAAKMELWLIPGLDEVDTFRADVHAAIPADDGLWDAVYRGFSQMIASDPADHRGMLADLDGAPRDGVLTYDDVRHSSLLVSLLSPDLLSEKPPMISFGFRGYFRKCAEGPCLDSTPFDHCFDRKLDADETDVDCGGSCRGCEAGAMCASASDCETVTCDQGHCGPPSCSDGVRDGLESDIDCGADCQRCGVGERCYFDADCESGRCGATVGDDSEDTCR